MASPQPSIPKPVSAGSMPRKKPISESKNVKMTFPTTLQPEAQDRGPTMSIADSAILRATLTQSRQTWINGAFSQLIEPTTLGPGINADSSGQAPLGLYTICIGPHMFFDTRFFAVTNPSRPQLPLESHPSAASSMASTPLDVSCSEQRIKEPPVPETLTSMAMELDDDPTPLTKPHGNLDTTTRQNASCEHTQESGHESNANPTTAANVDIDDKHAPPSNGIVSQSSGLKPKALPSQPQHQIAFEFKENPGTRWLFPYESSLEFVAADGNEPAKIAASFYLPRPEDLQQGPTPTGSDPNQGSGQVATMVILDANSELWTGLQQSISDSAATYRYMMDKMKHIPPRVYVQYYLPIDFSGEQLQTLGLKKLPDHRVVPLATSEPPPKRPVDTVQVVEKPKRARTRVDEKPPAPKGTASTKRASAANITSATSMHPKRCAYCGCTSTPMWRRGPGGPHSLCNACGVKWRSGRIIIETGDQTAAANPTPQLSSAAGPRHKQPTAAPSEKVGTESGGVRIGETGPGETTSNKRAPAVSKRQDVTVPGDEPTQKQKDKSTSGKKRASRGWYPFIRSERLLPSS
ncbi:hypothetical protein B0O80DRAFT_431961 [Mortierella sp. GBAus27b]|nr:hypothetical protein B0O80DRAFT_431961 [Mortierella sp. GBAus27b]